MIYNIIYIQAHLKRLYQVPTDVNITWTNHGKSDEVIRMEMATCPLSP